MPFKVIVTRDFDHMSEVAAQIVVKDIKNTLHNKNAYVLGLATGNTPTHMIKISGYNYFKRHGNVSCLDFFNKVFFESHQQFAYSIFQFPHH